MNVVKSGYLRVLSEICRLPFLFGVFPFRVADDSFLLSLPCLFSSVALICLYCVQGAFVIAHPSSFYTVSPLIYLIYGVELFTVRLSLFTSVFWLLRLRSTLGHFASVVSRVDLFLATHGQFLRFPVNYLEEGLFLGMIILFSLNHTFSRTITLWHFSKNLTYYATISALTLVAIQFRRLVRFLSLGFATLRKCLLGKTVTPALLEKVLIHFDDLYTASGILDLLFGPQTLLIIFCSFLFTTANIYFFYRSLFLNETAWENVIRVGWVVIFTTIAYNIVSPCKTIAHEAKEFNSMLYQLMIEDKTNEIANNKKLRLHIAMKREITFTACGFFTLDYTLVHSMIAAATTYLVILIQFGQPTPGDSTTAPPLTEVYTNSTVSYDESLFSTLPTILSTP